MSSPEDQQARDTIRTAHEETLFVEAGAGTGKTTALVARVVEMVATGRLADMAGLAAITFTENAAAELRTRIREALEEAARDAVEGRMFTEDERACCRGALATLDEATISTLHGFAARILSEVPLEAGLPPGFSVSDAITAQLQGARSWRRFVDELLDDVSVQDHVVAGLTLGLTLAKLRDLANTFAANWDLLLDRPFGPGSLPPIDATPVVTALRRALEALDDAPEDDGLTNHLRTDVRPAVEELSSLEDPFDVLEALSRLNIKKKIGNAGKWKQHGGKDRVMDELNRARQSQAELIAAVGAAVTGTLCGRVQDFVLEEAERRRTEGRLEFHDLLVRTRDVLRNDATVRRRMNARFAALLVDEFQDTDPLQVEIVCLVAGDCSNDPPESWEDIPIPGGRLFFVGDPKQSIYRFRRANVALYERVGQLHNLGRTSLEVNFRSVAGVVQPVNDLFGLIMQGVQGQVSYANLKWHREGGEDQRLTIIGGPIGAAKAPQVREREAAHIAGTIRRAQRDQWPVERDDGRSEPVSYGDMAVLLPTRTSLPALEKALQAANVPYRVESRSLVWATDAVRDVVTILQALVNPADQVALVAALRHHGLACSDLQLTEWAGAGGRWNYLAPPPEGIAPDHSVATGMARLRAWHDLRWWMPPNHLVERLVRELRLAELTAELRRPRDHWRRLRFVVDQARAFCDAGGSGLSEFVAWAVEQIESEADVLETAVPEPDDDSVRILTVHGSKGLEFPLTILSGLGAPPRSGTDVVWGNPCPEVRLKKDTLQSGGYVARSAEDKALGLAESVRLLYVAMTRARDYLVVGSYHKPVKGQNAQPSHAQHVWMHLHESPLVSLEPSRDASDVTAATAMDTRPPSGAALPDPAAFIRERADLLAAVRSRVAASATSLVAESDQAHAKDGPPVSDAARPAPAFPGKGASLGSAVHGVLELVDLAGPAADEVAAISVLLCDELGIPDLAGEVQTRVQHALTARRVAEAGASGRYWREVYVVARDGARYVEGYIDLLVEEDDGVFVVDYKTDRVSGDVEAKAEHYSPQLRAYADSLRQIPGVEVSGAALLLVNPQGAVDVDINLDDDR